MFNQTVSINKMTLRDDTKKKECEEQGIPRQSEYFQTDSPDLPKSCPNDSNYIAGYGCPALKYILITAI